MIIKKKWKQIELFVQGKVNQSRYNPLGGIAEISATIKGLKYMGVMVSTSPFKSAMWTVQKTDESWRMELLWET